MRPGGVEKERAEGNNQDEPTPCSDECFLKRALDAFMAASLQKGVVGRFSSCISQPIIRSAVDCGQGGGRNVVMGGVVGSLGERRGGCEAIFLD